MKVMKNKEINMSHYERSIYGKLKHPFIMLAPLSGVTDVPFRLIARKYGCQFAFTEMVDVNGIHYNNLKTAKMFDRPKEDSPLGAQIVGQDEDRMLTAAKICEDKGFHLVDINAGCPAKKVIKGGKGSALLKDPRRLGSIIRRLTSSLTIPVTVKIRSGWDKDSKNYLEVAKIIEEEGAKAICIHARTQEQMYKGKPDHNITKEIKETVSIPVIASGNVFSPNDARNILDQTGCAGVAVARGALGRPWIFREIESYLIGELGESHEPTFDEVKDIMREHFLLSVEHYGLFLTLKRMYKHVTWYLKGYKNLDLVMKNFKKIEKEENFDEFLNRLHLKDERRMEL